MIDGIAIILSLLSSICKRDACPPLFAIKVRPGSCKSDCRKHNIHAHLGYAEYYTLKLKLQRAKPLTSFILLYIVSYLEQKGTFAFRECHTSNNLYICLNRRRPPMIDLRSDTVTLPTPAMREAM